MKKYIIAFILFCLALFGIDEVYAVNSENWVSSIKHPLLVKHFSCSSSTTCTTEKSLSSEDVYSYLSNGTESPNPGSFFYTSSYSMPTNGIAWVYNTGTAFRKGYQYIQNTYVCQSDASTYFELDDYGLDGGTSYNRGNVTKIYSTANIIGAQNVYAYTSAELRCQYFSTIFTATENTKTYSIKLDTTKTVNARYFLMGYETISLGQADLVTTSSLNSAISNSGLASAESVEEVQQATQELKEEVTALQEQQEQQHNETMNTITDSDSSGATNDATGFFSSFSSSDNGGISSIITAPLSMINTMLNVNTLTCSPLTVNILGKSVDLPCGKLLWSRAPSSITILWQTIICGYFSYKLIVSLFHDIDKLKNPEEKGVDTLDL